jgi:hypothetical protein
MNLKESLRFLGDSHAVSSAFLNSYRLIRSSLPAREALEVYQHRLGAGEFHAAQVVLAMPTTPQPYRNTEELVCSSRRMVSRQPPRPVPPAGKDPH